MITTAEGPRRTELTMLTIANTPNTFNAAWKINNFIDYIACCKEIRNPHYCLNLPQILPQEPQIALREEDHQLFPYLSQIRSGFSLQKYKLS
jgi:hypothetical protein